jgi:hypothetical protein
VDKKEALNKQYDTSRTHEVMVKAQRLADEGKCEEALDLLSAWELEQAGDLEGSLYCQAFTELRDSLSVKYGASQVKQMVELADQKAEQGKCEEALDMLSDWEVEKGVTAEVLVEETEKELRELDTLLDKTIQEIELDKKDTVVEKPERSFENSFSLRADYYHSQEYDYQDTSIVFSPEDTIEIIPGSEDLTGGLEYKFRTKNPNSFFRNTYNKLTLLNEYSYERLENDLGWYMFNENLDLNLNSILSIKQNHWNDSTSFADIVVKPRLNYQSKAAHRFSGYIYGEIKRFKIQKAGYEDFDRTLFNLNYSYVGETGDMDLDFYDTKKEYSDSTHKNYTIREISWNGRYYLSDQVNLEVYAGREILTYYNHPLGHDREKIFNLEGVISTFHTANLDINFLLAFENVNYRQFDSIPANLADSLAIDTVFHTDYSALRRTLEPSFVYKHSDRVSFEGSLKGEVLRVELQRRQSRDDPVYADYFVPKEDNYNSGGWSLNINYNKIKFDGTFGLLYEIIKYQEEAELDNPDYRSLRMMGDIVYSFTKKLTFMFNGEWPFPGFKGENTIDDKSFSVELEYKL